MKLYSNVLSLLMPVWFGGTGGSIGGITSSLIPPSFSLKKFAKASLDPTGTLVTKEVLEGLEQPEIPVPQAAEAPTVTDPDVQEAKRKERALARRRRGRSATLLTGQSGLSDGTNKKTLLGQ